MEKNAAKEKGPYREKLTTNAKQKCCFTFENFKYEKTVTNGSYGFYNNRLRHWSSFCVMENCQVTLFFPHKCKHKK